MRLANLFAARNGFEESDIAGVTIDVVVGLFAGLALIVGVWLLASAMGTGSTHLASALSFALNT